MKPSRIVYEAISFVAILLLGGLSAAHVINHLKAQFSELLPDHGI
jgi:hypothetical protein